MFNKVHAEFAGTVTEVLIDQSDGVIVTKGEVLYRIKPDEVAEEIDNDALAQVRLTHTAEQLNTL